MLDHARPTRDGSACSPLISARHMADADLSLATKNLGKSWQIDEVAIKPIPACHFTVAHAAADAAIALSAKLGPKPGDDRSVEVLVPGRGGQNRL